MTPGRSKSLLGGGLLITLLAAWFAPPQKDESLMLSERAQKTRPASSEGRPTYSSPGRATSGSSLDVLNIRPRTTSTEDDAMEGRLFTSSQWVPSSKQVPVSTVTDLSPPPPPQAPPLPFHFLGRYEDAGQSVVFLQYNDQSLVVRQGDTLGEQYKVEKLDETTLSLRYLPLNQLQSLEVGFGR